MKIESAENRLIPVRAIHRWGVLSERAKERDEERKGEREGERERERKGGGEREGRREKEVIGESPRSLLRADVDIDQGTVVRSPPACLPTIPFVAPSSCART